MRKNQTSIIALCEKRQHRVSLFLVFLLYGCLFLSPPLFSAPYQSNAQDTREKLIELMNGAYDALSNKNYSLADSLLDESEILVESKDTRNRSIMAYYRGLTLESQGNFDLALDQYYLAAKLGDLTLRTLGHLNHHIANILVSKENAPDKALVYYQAAIENSDSINWAGIILEKSIAYLKLYKPDSAFLCIQQANEYFINQGNKSGQAYASLYFGKYYHAIGDKKSALEYFRKSYNYAKEIKDQNYIRFLTSSMVFTINETIKNEEGELLSDLLKDQALLTTTNADISLALLTSILSFLENQSKIDLMHSRQTYLLFGVSLLILFLLLLYYILRLRTKKKENRLIQQLTRIQINPHFIFNSLNSLQRHIIEGDISASNRYLTKFSRLIRRILENTRENYILLADEISFLEDYISLEKLRFKGAFEYQINLDPEIDKDKVSIPTMIIQPFIENAIWHGLVPKNSESAMVIVDWKLHEGIILCTIEDNGVGRACSKAQKDKANRLGKSMGTQLIRNRLDQLSKLYKKDFNFVYEDLVTSNNECSGTRVIISIPVTWKA